MEKILLERRRREEKEGKKYGGMEEKKLLSIVIGNNPWDMKLENKIMAKAAIATAVKEFYFIFHK